MNYNRAPSKVQPGRERNNQRALARLKLLQERKNNSCRTLKNGSGRNNGEQHAQPRRDETRRDERGRGWDESNSKKCSTLPSSKEIIRQALFSSSCSSSASTTRPSQHQTLSQLGALGGYDGNNVTARQNVAFPASIVSITSRKNYSEEDSNHRDRHVLRERGPRSEQHHFPTSSSYVVHPSRGRGATSTTSTSSSSSSSSTFGTPSYRINDLQGDDLLPRLTGKNSDQDLRRVEQLRTKFYESLQPSTTSDERGRSTRRG
ncbi:unnamed protein product, partial [Amoebophrya sp. A25]|eukprot:GSA25T00010157001.1